MFAFGHGKIVDGAGNFKKNKIEGRENKGGDENDTDEAKRRPYRLENNG